jgi:hypothetical protein
MMLLPLVNLREFVNLALVIYPELLRHRLAPELSPASLQRMLRSGPSTEVEPTTLRPQAVSRIPPEIWLQIAESLEPANSLALIFAIGPLFWRIPGNHILELRSLLRATNRRSRQDAEGT